MKALTAPQRWHLKQACRTLAAGGVIAYPTEAVYGLGCDPLDAEAVMRLLAIKQRDVARGLILIADGIERLLPYVDFEALAGERRAAVLQSWPGPSTWLIPVRAATPWWLSGDHDTLAVRVTAHPLSRALCRMAGRALVSTSANLSGRDPARTALQVRRTFADRLDYILTGSTAGLHRPTEIRDARNGRIIRAGQGQASSAG